MRDATQVFATGLSTLENAQSTEPTARVVKHILAQQTAARVCGQHTDESVEYKRG